MLWTQLFLVISLSGALKLESRPRSTSAKRLVPSGRQARSAFQPPNLLPSVVQNNEGSARSRSSSRRKAALNTNLPTVNQGAPNYPPNVFEEMGWPSPKSDNHMEKKGVYQIILSEFQNVRELGGFEAKTRVLSKTFSKDGISEVHVVLAVKPSERMQEVEAISKVLQQYLQVSANSIIEKSKVEIEAPFNLLITTMVAGEPAHVQITFHQCFSLEDAQCIQRIEDRIENHIGAQPTPHHSNRNGGYGHQLDPLVNAFLPRGNGYENQQAVPTAPKPQRPGRRANPHLIPMGEIPMGRQ